jgi:hypothetical protein
VIFRPQIHNIETLFWWRLFKGGWFGGEKRWRMLSFAGCENNTILVQNSICDFGSSSFAALSDSSKRFRGCDQFWRDTQKDCEGTGDSYRPITGPSIEKPDDARLKGFLSNTWAYQLDRARICWKWFNKNYVSLLFNIYKNTGVCT